MLDPRLSYLIAVARWGSFTAAAQAVGVTQSAVTKSVADLERQLGYAVFHRSPCGALITEKGRDFVERAARLMEDAQELLSGSATKGDAFAGVLRIGVCPASLEWWLIDPIARLQTKHPTIRFDISGSTFERMVQQLRNGVVNVVVGFDAAFGEWPDIRREAIGKLRSLLFVRHDHPLLAKGDRMTLTDLSRYEFVSPSDSRPYGATIRNIYESQGIELRERLHVIDYFPIVRRIVANSDAIGVVAQTYIKSPSFQRQFRTLDHLDVFDELPICCAVRARWDTTPAVRAFIATVRQDGVGSTGMRQTVRA
jgi:DNA-binding transcriptional LysR family regulator